MPANNEKQSNKKQQWDLWKTTVNLPKVCLERIQNKKHEAFNKLGKIDFLLLKFPLGT